MITRNKEGKRNKDEEAKTLILKKFFNSSTQKKAVERAAAESIRDQRILLDKYNEMVRQ